MKKKCVLAYSGGLDTSAIIPWLIENHDCEVIAYCCNVGNLPQAEFLRDRALKLGASDFVYEDSRDEFVQDFVFPMLRAGATYLDDYLLGTAIARPLIASRVARFATEAGANLIAHGATGKGNDHIRFERALAYLVPGTAIIAPWKSWHYRSRAELAAYLKERDYPWDEIEKTYSVDSNILHRSTEGGKLEEVGVPFQIDSILGWCSPNGKLEAETTLSIEFREGDPVALNQKPLGGIEILEALNEVGAQYGVGICDMVEERTNGIKSRGVYETPGGTILHTALRALKQICWSRDLYQTAQPLADQYGEIIYDGLWFSDVRRSIGSFFTDACKTLSGTVSLTITRGQVRIASRQSPFSLYQKETVSFETDQNDINKAALGFGQILSIPVQIQGMRDRRNS